MKVYALPEELPAPTVDYTNFDLKAANAAETDHTEKLKAFLVANGYPGENTGLIYSTGIADGFANYMIADKPRGGILIHLPYGDGWQSRDVEFLPKAEIIKRAKKQANRPKLCDLM